MHPTIVIYEFTQNKKKLIIYEAHFILPSPKQNLNFNLNKVFSRQEKAIAPSNPTIIY